ncbi:MAG: phosphoribosylanthranilate isomerase [Archaeoglobus sp.]|nr:phosphoribosylanthranilate isomerase [Archaeoglobus sp.]
MKVKICGIRDLDELKICISYADAVGFVTEYPIEVPWNLSRDDAKELIARTPPFIFTVVVTTGSVEKIVEIAKHTNANAIQLHGNESVKEVKGIRDELEGVKLIKALPVDAEADGPRILGQAMPYAEVVDAMLLDSKTDEMPAGTGKTFNWEIAREIRERIEKIGKPLILAGGLNSENVERAIQTVRPYALDVISGVETNGRKDERKVREFVRAAKHML